MLLYVESSIFANNSATQHGGGFALESDTIIPFNQTLFYDVLFFNNSASRGGGAMFISVESLDALSSNVEIDEVYVEICDTLNPPLIPNINTFKNITFSHNRANRGASVYLDNDHSILGFNNIQFTNNSAAEYGGGLYIAYGTRAYDNSRWMNNAYFEYNNAGYAGLYFPFYYPIITGNNYSFFRAFLPIIFAITRKLIRNIPH